ncbi:hypothetical protein QJQ45_006822 [Haematococcus lacustris]|nr:hypothetical protein QJQ45_006822 [Haematococcus lacustris]
MRARGASTLWTLHRPHMTQRPTRASPSSRCYVQAMERIHAIQDDGTVLTDIAVFRKLYEAVGLGWVYAITANPTIERLANLVYGFWAKYRMQVTGREALEVILARRRAQGTTSLCDSSAEAACELPEPRKAAAVEASQQVR